MGETPLEEFGNECAADIWLSTGGRRNQQLCSTRAGCSRAPFPPRSSHPIPAAFLLLGVAFSPEFWKCSFIPSIKEDVHLTCEFEFLETPIAFRGMFQIAWEAKWNESIPASRKVQKNPPSGWICFFVLLSKGKKLSGIWMKNREPEIATVCV